MVKVDVVSRKLARASAWLEDAEQILSKPTEEFLAGAVATGNRGWAPPPAS